MVFSERLIEKDAAQHRNAPTYREAACLDREAVCLELKARGSPSITDFSLLRATAAFATTEATQAPSTIGLEDWQILCQKKQSEAAAKIPLEWRLDAQFTDGISETASNNVLDVPRKCGLLSEEELEITENYDATALLEKIRSKEMSSYDVTEAFCKRAAIAQQVTFCLTETFFDRALSRAKELDEYLEITGKPVGPLHGLPVSLKDCFNVEGIPSTIGFTSFIKNGPAKHNTPLVQILLDLGAVLYCKTNIPQTMMAGDSHNYVFGRCLNPHRSNLSAGGSSGGEGALIAMRGSVLGIGTDIAGSIRIPSVYNGVYAIRPSADRLPYAGQTSSARAGLAGIKACAGPLATSVRDLELLTRCIVESDPWKLDSSAIFSKWQSVNPFATSKLRIGLILEDDYFPLHPPVLRTMNRAVAALENVGHTLVSLTSSVPSIKEACLLAFRFFQMDPASTTFKFIEASGEPRIPALSNTSMPSNEMPYQPSPLTLEALYDMNVQRRKFQEQFRELMVQNKIDVILMPGYQGTAPQHDVCGWVPYTVLLNLLDYPACILPYGKADKDADADFLRGVEYRPPYVAEEVDGAPCCVQLVGRNFQEEKLFLYAQEIDRVLRR